MRRRNLILSILCGGMLLASCNTGEASITEGNTDISKLNSGMEVIVEEIGEAYGGDYTKDMSIYRNTYTDVLYLWVDEYKSAGLVEMHDPETGLPLKYEKYQGLKRFNKIEVDCNDQKKEEIIILRSKNRFV